MRAVTQIKLSDGRQLGYAVLGDPDGRPLVVMHGTPGSTRQIACLARAASERGIAMIAPDRAGYGESSYDPARTIASSARDVGEVMAHLDLPPCAVIGISGGGPTALACAVVLAGQVTAVATVGGVAPLVPRDAALPPSQLVIRIALRSEAATRAMLSLGVRAGRRNPEKTLNRFAGAMAEPDATLLREDAGVRAAFLDDMSHPSPTTARAMAHDFWLFARAWDVDIADIAVPAHIWHGTLDRNVPVQHGRVVADRCPTARLHVVDGGGHMLLDQLDDILASVTAPAP